MAAGRALGSVLLGLVLECHLMLAKCSSSRIGGSITAIAPISQSGGTFEDNHGCETWTRLSLRAGKKDVSPFLLLQLMPPVVETGQGCFFICAMRQEKIYLPHRQFD